MLFSTLREKDFFGRSGELSELYRRSLDVEKGVVPRIFLAGARGIGKTELLGQLFNHLFWKQDRVAPFFYVPSNAILSATDFSKDYFTQFLCQRLAFEKKEQTLLSLDGLTIGGLATLVEERNAAWASALLERYTHSSGEPLDALRIALSAPHQSALATGKSVVLMIDEFQRLKGLRREGDVQPELVSLFEAQLSSLRTAWVMSGSEMEIQEMPVAASLTKFNLFSLSENDAVSLFLSLLGKYGIEPGPLPPAFLRHLGGNPLYLKRIAAAAPLMQSPDGRNFWKVYIQEIMEGGIYQYWSALLKQRFPDLDARRSALDVLNKTYQAGGPLTCQRMGMAIFPEEGDGKGILGALHLSGLLLGEFGAFRAPEDRVLKDVVAALTQREIQGKSPQEIEQELLEGLPAPEEKLVSFEMVLPALKDAELVAAQCLEQIGKNLHVNQDAIGQLQMALIEACINAIEYGAGEKKKIFIRFDFVDGRLAISVESAGREFAPIESGEPYAGMKEKEKTGRGWGVKLMKNFADAVRFEKTARGTRVVLIKNLQKSSEAEKEGAADV